MNMAIFAKICPKKPEKPIPDAPHLRDGHSKWERTAKPSKQQNPASKNLRNRFEVLDMRRGGRK